MGNDPAVSADMPYLEQDGSIVMSVEHYITLCDGAGIGPMLRPHEVARRESGALCVVLSSDIYADLLDGNQTVSEIDVAERFDLHFSEEEEKFNVNRVNYRAVC